MSEYFHKNNLLERAYDDNGMSWQASIYAKLSCGSPTFQLETLSPTLFLMWVVEALILSTCFTSSTCTLYDVE